jgi:hypothetical protein
VAVSVVSMHTAGYPTCFAIDFLSFHYVGTVASRPRFGGDSQAFSWVVTSWKGSAGQGPARVSLCL